jgi:hypothetical protein
MDATTQANIAAGEAFATAIAPAFGAVPAAAITAATALLNAVLAKGNGMTMDDFNAAVLLDEAAIADDLAAQKAATLP